MTTDRAREDEHRVAVAGDWHGNKQWAKQMLMTLKADAPDIRTLLHVGDFGLWPERRHKSFLHLIDKVCLSTGIDQVLVTPGNHEHWGDIQKVFAKQPGEAVQLSQTVWVLPRGYRFQLGQRSVLSFGGAVSVDRAYRQQGHDWWPDESPTDEDVDRAVEGGPVDIMISHDAPQRGTTEVKAILEGPSRWLADALADAEMARSLVSQVRDAVRPRVLAHGHFHVKGALELPDQRWVYSLAADGSPGNMAVLNLNDFAWEWLQ